MAPIIRAQDTTYCVLEKMVARLQRHKKRKFTLFMQLDNTKIKN